jgi:hypothetical protein
MRPARLQDLQLRAALHPDADVAARAAREWSAEVDLDTLDFASLTLLPLLGERELPVEPALSEQITKVARMSWLRTESLARQVAPAIAALKSDGIEPILMKGAALVYAFDVPARLRPMFDIDVLIAPHEIPRAVEVLNREGFSARDQNALLRSDPRLLSLKHGTPFINEHEAEIDLHWSALQTVRRPELGAQLRERAIPATIAGAECSALGLEDLLVVTIAHAADRWRDMRERWVGDCVQLIRARDLDWDLVAGRARAWRLSSQVRDALEYLDEVAGIAAPPAARRELARAQTPFAIRARRPVSTRATRTLEDYEFEIADQVPFGARTGPADFGRYLVRRWGLAGLKELPGELAFVAAGRPWRSRRKLRAPRDRAASAYKLGERLDFGGDDPATRYLGCGWWFPEDFGIWSRGEFSKIRLGAELTGDAELTLGIYSVLNQQRPSIRLDVVVNEFRLARIQLTSAAEVHVIKVPAEALGGRETIELSFVVKSSVIPAELGTAPDQREIGIGLSELTLSPHRSNQ